MPARHDVLVPYLVSHERACLLAASHASAAWLSTWRRALQGSERVEGAALFMMLSPSATVRDVVELCQRASARFSGTVRPVSFTLPDGRMHWDPATEVTLASPTSCHYQRHCAARLNSPERACRCWRHQMQPLWPNMLVCWLQELPSPVANYLHAPAVELGCPMLSVQVSSMAHLTELRRELLGIVELIEHQDSAQASHSNAL